MGQDNQTTGRAVIVALPCISFVVVGLRLYSRIAQTYIGADDWFIVAAALLSVGLTYPSWQYFETFQLGLHTSKVKVPIDFVTVNRWIYIVQALYNPTLLLVKCSVLLFLYRLGQNLDNINKWVWALFWFNITWATALEIIILFQCTPIPFIWDPTIPGGHCIDVRSFFTFTSVIAIITDLLTLVPPIWVFSKMNMRRRLKIVVLATFLLGFVVTALSFWRLYSLVRFLYFPNSFPDFFYDISYVSSTFEINIAIITASMPALRALITRRRALQRGDNVLPVASPAARVNEEQGAGVGSPNTPLSVGSKPVRAILRKMHDSILRTTHHRTVQMETIRDESATTGTFEFTAPISSVRETVSTTAPRSHNQSLDIVESKLEMV